MDERTTLILGGSGFLGAHVTRVVAAEPGGRCVYASRRPLARAAAPRGGAEHVEWEASDAAATERLFDALAPRAVISAVALSRVADCDRLPERAWALNAELPVLAARLCREREARFVHVSTDLVFGGEPPRGARYDEHDPPSPVQHYGRTKAEGEARVLAENPAALVVRLPLLFGDSFGRGLGASDAVLDAIARGERPTLFCDEWRTPLDVAVAARALVEATRASCVGLLHVAGDERLSRWELARRAVGDGEGRTALRSALRADFGLEETRPSDVSLDARRARRVLRSSSN